MVFLFLKTFSYFYQNIQTGFRLKLFVMKHFFLLTLLGFFIFSFSSAKINPTQLTCEYLENPAVVDIEKPRLAWINIADDGESGQFQTAYQIRVASSKINWKHRICGTAKRWKAINPSG
jgi:hypothetical protein